MAEDKESFHAHISEVCTGDLLIFGVIEGFLCIFLFLDFILPVRDLEFVHFLPEVDLEREREIFTWTFASFQIQAGVSRSLPSA